MELMKLLERLVVSHEKFVDVYEKSMGLEVDGIIDKAMTDIIENRTATHDGPPEGAPDPAAVPPSTGPHPPAGAAIVDKSAEFHNYESMDLAQLKELTVQRGIPQKSGSRKSTYVKALKTFDDAAAAGSSPVQAATAAVPPSTGPANANPFAGQAPAADPGAPSGINPITGEPIVYTKNPDGSYDAPNPFGLTDKVDVNGVKYPTFIPHTRSEVDAAMGKFYNEKGGNPETLAILQRIMFESTGANMIANIPQEKYHDFIVALENYKG